MSAPPPEKDSASAAGGNAQVPRVYAEAVLNETSTQKTTKDQDSGFSLVGVSGGKRPNKGASTGNKDVNKTKPKPRVQRAQRVQRHRNRFTAEGWAGNLHDTNYKCESRAPGRRY